MVQRKMGRYWSEEEKWFLPRVWKKIRQLFGKKVPKMCSTCKGHTDDKVRKGLCCQTQTISPKYWP